MAGRGMRALKNRVNARLESMVKNGSLSKDRSGDFEITATNYGDYHGSVYERANLLTLSRDYGDIVSTATGVQGAAYGWIPRAIVSDAMFAGIFDIEERLTMVLDIIDRLSDYPIISDEDLSEVEEIIARESWDDYYAGEFRRAIESARAAACPACIAWDNNDDVPMCPDFVDHDVYDDARAYELFRAADAWPEFRATEMEWRGDMEAVADRYLAKERTAARDAEDALHSGGLFPVP